MKPIKYRLLLGELSNAQTASLKVLATVIFYVGRRAVKSNPHILVCNKKQEKRQLDFYFLIALAT